MKGKKSWLGLKECHFCEVCGLQSFPWSQTTKYGPIDSDNRCGQHAKAVWDDVTRKPRTDEEMKKLEEISLLGMSILMQ